MVTSTVGRGEQGEVEALVARVLAGTLHDLPPLHARVVRIFTSSTFTDMAVERNMLMETVYPRLKEYCQETHGLEFQIVDMRWGITDDATDDHMTTELCLKEILACQRVSVGPNFVIFLGQKYGYRPLPRVIPAQEFEMLLTEVAAVASDAELLRRWYRRDDNAVPPHYVLLTISTNLEYYNQKTRATMEKWRAARASWWDESDKMTRLLRRAAASLRNQSIEGALVFDDNKVHDYNMSVTESEVRLGLLQQPHAARHCLAYVRVFDDLVVGRAPPHVPAGSAVNYMDTILDKANEEAQRHLASVRNTLLSSAGPRLAGNQLPRENIKETHLRWTTIPKHKGVDVTVPDHARYLADFCEHFELNMKRLVDAGVASSQGLCAHALGDVYTECVQQLTACVEACRNFQGREDVLAAVSQYVGGVRTAPQPLVLYGESGCGKTSVMARAFSQVWSQLPSSCRPVLILRFLGTSPFSSSITSLLRNLCLQIAQNYDQPLAEVPTELSLLTQYFKKSLSFSSSHKPLIIFLDSLDQLSRAYSARKMQWLPAVIPPHAKLVLSTLPMCEGDDILGTLETKLKRPSQFVQIQTVGEDVGLHIVTSWLDTSNRTLTKQQKLFVQNRVRSCSLPLYLRLVYDDINRWRSFDVPTEGMLAHTIHASINKLFERLETKFGEILVQHAFAYLTCSMMGLSETELEDLLSLDDDVLSKVYQYHLPPIRRIPPLVWTRIRSEIPNYLTEREASGVTVINWYHRQFFEVAKARFLKNINFKLHIHSQIADYFLGTWAGCPKPFTYTQEQIDNGLVSGVTSMGTADRLVPGQALFFTDDSGQITNFNLRKLTEMPFQLLRAERYDDLQKEILFNYKWLHAKIRAMPIQTSIQDYDDYLRLKTKDIESGLVVDALRLTGGRLASHPDMLGPFITGRLIPYYKQYPNIQSLIKQCDIDGAKVNALLPAHHCMHTPGGPLQYSLVGHPRAPYGMALTSDNKYLVTASNIFIVWDLSIGDVWRTADPEIHGIIRGMALSPNDEVAVGYSHPENRLIFFYVMTGEPKIVENPLIKGGEIRGVAASNESVLVWSNKSWSLLDEQGVVMSQETMPLGHTILSMKFQTLPNGEEDIEMVYKNTNQVDITGTLIMHSQSNARKDVRFCHTYVECEDRKSIYCCGTQNDIVRYMYTGSAWVMDKELGKSGHILFALNLSPGETHLVATISPGFLVWDLRQHPPKMTDLKLVGGKKNYPQQVGKFQGHVAFTRNNAYMVTGVRDAICVWDMTTFDCVKTLPAHFERIMDILSVVDSDRNIVISSSQDYSIKLWNISNLHVPVPAVTQHDKQIDTLHVPQKGSLCVTTTKTCVGVWNYMLGSLLKSLNSQTAGTADGNSDKNTGAPARVTGAVMTSDGKFVIASESDQVVFWSGRNGELLDTYPQEDVRQLLLAQDDSLVYAISWRPVLYTAEGSDRNLMSCRCVGRGVPTGDIKLDFEYKSRTQSNAVLTNNGLYMVIPATGKTEEDVLAVWHVNTATFMYNLPLKHVDYTGFTKLSTMPVSPTQVVLIDSQKAVVADVNKKTWAVHKEPGIVRRLARWKGVHSNDGKYGLRPTGPGQQKGIELFNLEKGTTLQCVVPAESLIQTNSNYFFSGNDQHIVHYSHRGNLIRVIRFDDTSHKVIARFVPEANVTGLSSTPDGTSLVVGMSDGRLFTLVIGDDEEQSNRQALERVRSPAVMASTGSTLPKAHLRWKAAAQAALISTSKSRACVIS